MNYLHGWLGLFLAGTASAAILDVNLIRNPGAEEGDPGDGRVSIPVPEWDALGTRATSVSYFVHEGFPEMGDPGPPNRGTGFFAGGCCESPTRLRQWIDLSAAAGPVDDGAIDVTLSGWLGGYDAQNDHVTLTVTWLGSSSNRLGTVAVGPVRAAERADQTGMLLRTVSAPVPAGTRGAWVDLDFVREAGSYNDGYADNLSLVLRVSDCGRLSVGQVADRVVVSWPAGGPCGLEATETLPGPERWIRLGDIQTVDGWNYHTNQTGLGTRFYRLRTLP